MTTWSYGIIATPRRADVLLPRTLASLEQGGFPDPEVFMDTEGWGAFGNFALGLWRLYLRQPNAERLAMFQDDMVCYRNVRQYLEKCNYPDHGYWNLYTWPCNARGNLPGWSLSDQMGRGAVALVFDNETLRRLLASRYFVDHRRNSHNGHKAIDKAVIESMKRDNVREFIHNPSLVQHTGTYSTIGNGTHPESPVFNGESFDAMELLT